ncbi:DUF4374 domain-containing protein [Dyadobacter psychrotolerans]|uniref:DUF4374 domain-containing protein n=1 Tax=Dyadobacter psychrotolerans TaxID=2541721 RepID=A0A4R5DKC4_9BACT|nr:DUF4374 domain-containing protein [Dyadobacter psychrotolerans]TDE11295.1 DUF4374 domain-containing protein [Dyadobacter psychrotolerans]
MKYDPFSMRAGGILALLSLIIITIIISGCSENTDSGRKKYSIYTMTKDYREYIVQVDSLSQGTVNPVLEGTIVGYKQIWDELIVKEGYYYRINRKSQHFVRSQINKGRFEPADSVALADFVFLENYNWIHPDTLLLISYNRKLNKVNYAKVAVKTMTATTGELPIPAPSGAYNSMSVGFTEFRGNRLFAGYSYHSLSDSNGYSTTDTAYVSVLNYPSLKSRNTIKDTRSTYPGNTNTEQQSTFRDEKGDFYFLTSPGIARGNRPDKPTAVYRIKAGQEVLDSNYFFNISESSIQNHAYGLWYIGNGKAIIRSEQKGLFTGIEDHYKVPHVRFFVLDLETKSAKLLNLPVDKGTARQCVLMENGLVYISINSDREGNYIWIYNPENDKLRKGLKIEGDVDYILRIERLYEE